MCGSIRLACDYISPKSTHTMFTRLSVYRQGEKVSAMDKINGYLRAVVICGCVGEGDYTFL